MTETFTITKDFVDKLLGVVDAGLCSGMGRQEPGQMCVEAAVCYAMGLPHGDKPTCVSGSVRHLKVHLNDTIGWVCNESRAHGLREIAIAQLGSAGAVDDRLFINAFLQRVIKYVVPHVLLHIIDLAPELKNNIQDLSLSCAQQGSIESLEAVVTYLAPMEISGWRYGLDSDADEEDDDADGDHVTAINVANRFYDRAACVTRCKRELSESYGAHLSSYIMELSTLVTKLPGEPAEGWLRTLARLGIEALRECGSPGCDWLYLCESPK